MLTFAAVVEVVGQTSRQLVVTVEVQQDELLPAIYYHSLTLKLKPDRIHTQVLT